MADEERDVRIEHPNRKKAASKITRADRRPAAARLGAGLLAIITLGGWDHARGRQAAADRLHRALPAAGVLRAALEPRRAAGHSALAIIMLIFAAVSAPHWFDRDKAGFTSPALDETCWAC